MIEKISIRYGLLTALALIAFFFFMKAIGLIEQYELRMLNIILLFTGIYLSVKNYQKHVSSSHYLGGLGVGLFTSAVALLIFATFVIIYLANSPIFMETLQSHEYFGRYLNPYIAGAAIFIEGTISGLLLSFILMQYYKRSRLSDTEPALP